MEVSISANLRGCQKQLGTFIKVSLTLGQRTKCSRNCLWAGTPKGSVGAAKPAPDYLIMTVADVAIAKKGRKGPARGITEKGAYWVVVDAKIDQRGGEAVGQNSSNKEDYFRIRHCLGGRTILIDASTGNDKDLPCAPPLDHLHGPFLQRLAAIGVRPEEVDFVLLTDLHADHVGWNTRLATDAGRRLSRMRGTSFHARNSATTPACPAVSQPRPATRDAGITGEASLPPACMSKASCR